MSAHQEAETVQTEVQDYVPPSLIARSENEEHEGSHADDETIVEPHPTTANDWEEVPSNVNEQHPSSNPTTVRVEQKTDVAPTTVQQDQDKPVETTETNVQPNQDHERASSRSRGPRTIITFGPEYTSCDQRWETRRTMTADAGVVFREDSRVSRIDIRTSLSVATGEKSNAPDGRSNESFSKREVLLTALLANSLTNSIMSSVKRLEDFRFDDEVEGNNRADE
ncbi:hypothetical protein TREMEDRAFT_60890 [Tremella mesenterica DSM 1558]|uniref:uncharacterized protein n=1 Tax=Tremella mesenterica (strain ATCC 24925 / CBS 8224 / DSM 1558 / NBRC 9311 / NRRL Y-6157 / RJB 2259-6 / UBC 559-6) TaxID=578456 RepID=UPI0003F49F89|nr:uncharacterized protein TREMEDRAFT_60890 [Tremella mesenterica DSM 1558]EIW70393.1 hypothetical protein TREMEDRAFT_60890 [Tremella mesenterica DSM 1558]